MSNGGGNDGADRLARLLQGTDLLDQLADAVARRLKLLPAFKASLGKRRNVLDGKAKAAVQEFVRTRRRT